ncbi:DUF4880 domain-containing protein [Sphingosinicella sp. LHD-64]|uniref:FecR family protein n=1 Tax=Sphingosinicella sp. LHD-64 TaxID=3072139 RepID=UPI002810386F|nr:DUF4880 domain-containing protein [Sphingosinicella sp. LHD-64]MDQ8757545.1 DUF4880 domain-containing protein [Sphingosinicella sp. LHD-64]
MTGKLDRDDGLDGLLVEAADWLVRLTSREATTEDARQLEEWRALSPEHEAAFREIAGVRNYARVAHRTRPPINRRAVLTGAGAGAAALFAGLGLARPPLGLWPSLAELMADHRTAVGGRFAFAPAAGVDVEMSSRTSVSVIDGGQGISLIGGEAFISAAAQRQPFVIGAEPVRLAVSDAQLNVQVLASMTRISCVAGVVTCETADGSTQLSANEALTIGAGGVVRRARIDGRRAIAWRRGLLIFEGTPLSEVVDQINLYREGRVILDDASLGALPVNAVFHTGQIQNAVSQIELLLGLRARRIAGGVVLLG